MEVSRKHGGISSILAVGSALFLALAALWLVYRPGLTGGFLLDDFGNLDSLSYLTGEITWEKVRSFLNSGVAGPVGRPLSLLTFLADDNSWPSVAYQFKSTNVALHILNSLLVFWLTLLLLERAKGASRNTLVIAVLLSMIWAFNPYHVSTVLYVIQRMTLLVSFFVLLGVIIFVKGRSLLEHDDGFAKGVAMIVLAYAVGVGLGVLSKENAVLFVLLVPLIDWIFFSRGSHLDEVREKRVLRPLILLPAFLLAFAMIAQWPSFQHKYEWFRDFSLAERLMTQTRALGYYLWHYLVPGSDYIGLYGDAFPVSKSFLEPLSTLFWTLFHAGIIGLALYVRDRFSLFTFAVLFYYVAHILESSFVPLMLFFEHRNYLPSVFLFLPLAMLPTKRWVIALMILFVVGEGIFLKARADVWGDDYGFRAAQVEKNPESGMAVLALASWHIRAEDYDAAVELLRDFSKRNAADLRVAILLIQSACDANDVRESDIQIFKRSPMTSRGKSNELWDLGTISQRINGGVCGPLSHDDMRQFVENYRTAFPRDAERMQAYYRARALVEAYAGDFPAFFEAGIASVREHPDAGITLEFCGTLLRYGYRDAACSCLAQGRHAFHGANGSTRTVVRSLLGFHDQRREAYEEMRRFTCSSEPSQQDAGAGSSLNQKKDESAPKLEERQEG